MRRVMITAALLLIANTPAQAQNLDALRQALDQMPANILGSPEPGQAYFVNVAVLQTLSNRQGTQLTPRSLSRAQLGAELRPIDALYSGGIEDWHEKAGLSLEEVRYFAGFGREPHKVAFWGLKDDAAAAGLIEDLTGLDFLPTDTEGVLGNGEPLAIDIARRNPGDPWRSQVGAATFAAARGAAVVQTTTPDAMLMLLGDTPSAGDQPIVRATMVGLESAVGDHQIVQAMVISPLIGIPRLDPASLRATTAGDIEALKESLAAQLEDGRKGIPPYFGGIIADTHLDRPAVSISLAYADCETAETAASVLEQRWSETMPEGAQGAISSGTVPSPEGLCAATLTVVGDTGDHTVNPVFGALLNAFMRQSLTVLQIGESL